MIVVFVRVSFLTISPCALAASDGTPTSSKTASSTSIGDNFTGKATYYPDSLNGHKTANGQRFHQSGSTAASNSLPLGTHVKVTNLKTGKTTTVKITDRGPKLGSHKIDLSKKAAKEIGLNHKEGKVPVKINVSRSPGNYTDPPATQ